MQAAGSKGDERLKQYTCCLGAGVIEKVVPLSDFLVSHACLRSRLALGLFSSKYLIGSGQAPASQKGGTAGTVRTTLRQVDRSLWA